MNHLKSEHSIVKRIRGLLIVFMVLFAVSCGGKKVVLSTTDQTALFTPVEVNADVEMYVDLLDGKPVRFGENDAVEIDAGSHNIQVRLEFKPLSGSAIVVGGFESLLVGAATNKTFSTEMEMTLEAGHEYVLVANETKEGFDVLVRDSTKNAEIVKHSFGLKDGKLTRLF